MAMRNNIHTSKADVLYWHKEGTVYMVLGCFNMLIYVKPL